MGRINIEIVSFSLMGDEGDAVYEMMKEEGFPPTPAGIKAFLLKMAHEDPEEAEESEGLAGDVAEILAALRNNPEAVQQLHAVKNMAKEKATDFIRGLAQTWLKPK